MSPATPPRKPPRPWVARAALSSPACIAAGATWLRCSPNRGSTMTDHELPLVAFLAGDLEPTTARAVDEHLLSCDQCWLAAREDRAGRALAGLLREPTDPGLADRIRLAVDLAPVPEHGRRVHSTRAHTGVSAAATAVIAL